jgi:MscS family membrane protein
MKLKFEPFYRGWLLFLLMTLVWGLWAGAQTNTNTAPSVAPPPPSAPGLLAQVEKLDRQFLTFGLDRVAFLRDHALFGEPLWKYLASLIYIFLAFYVSKLIDFITGVWLKRWASKTQTRLDDVLLELLHGPVKVVAFVIFLHIGLNLFRWPPIAQKILSRGSILIVAGSITYLALKLVEMALEFWKKRSVHEADGKFNDQLFSVIRKSLNAFIIVVALLVTAQNLGINITAVITSLSIGGLAVGLAAQDTLANLFGAISVFADKPFRVGDQIKMDVVEGTVEAVGLRSTRVRNADGYLVAIPNKTMGNAAIANITRRAGIKTTVNLVLPADLPEDKVKRALALLDQIYRKHPLTQDLCISFNQFAGRNLNILILHWSKGNDYQKYLAGLQEINLAIKAAFTADGITLA